MTTPDTEALRAALAKMTPGPWYTLDPPWLPSGSETSILAESPDPHVARFICDFDLWALDDEDDAARKSEVPDWDAAGIVALRNAAPALLDALDAANARLAELEAEIARLQTQYQPEWFYLAGDMSSDKCRFAPSEVIDEDWLWDNRAEGSAVVQIETAVRCPDIWCAVHFFTDEDKDARQSDDEYEITEHATEEEARAAINKDQTDD